MSYTINNLKDDGYIIKKVYGECEIELIHPDTGGYIVILFDVPNEYPCRVQVHNYVPTHNGGSRCYTYNELIDFLDKVNAKKYIHVKSAKII